jgi:hypothetical protein
MKADALQQVFSTYNLLKDSIKVTKRSINRELDVLHSNTVFFGQREDEMISTISSVEIELDDIMILSLFASFERELRLSIQTIIDSNVQKTNPFIIRIVELTSDSIERWAMKDIVDTFEEIVNDAIRSQVKQIYDYRNWVAHGKNIDKMPPIRTDPKIVFMVLTDFITQASTVM